MASPVQQLMVKEVDRKQFLLYMGAVVLALTGVSGFIKALTEPRGGSSMGSYGGTGYGNGATKDEQP
jgi:hypothetical protein